MRERRLSKPLVLAAIGAALGCGLWLGRAIAVPAPVAVAPAHEPPAAPKRYKVPVSSTQPSVGPADALVTIVEWCDLPDPACAALEPALQRIRKEHPDSVRLVFRHYGGVGHAGSALAHRFLRACFDASDKFWQARALLLAHRGELTERDVKGYAARLGLDWDAIASAMNSATSAGYITADRLFADMFEVKSVPALFVNGRPVGEHPTGVRLSRLVEQEMRAAAEMVAHGTPKRAVYAELIKHAQWKRIRKPLR